MYAVEKQYTDYNDSNKPYINFEKILENKPYLDEGYVLNTLSNSEDIIFKGVDFNEFLSNPEYAQKVINYYNLLKRYY